MTENWISIAAMILAALAAVGLIILYRKGPISQSGLQAMSAMLKDLKVKDANVNRLMYYASIAVDAVEQMAKSGAIEPTNVIKKQTAMNVVENMALADNINLSRIQLAVAEDLVESAVYNLPRNQPPDNE